MRCGDVSRVRRLKPLVKHGETCQKQDESEPSKILQKNLKKTLDKKIQKCYNENVREGKPNKPRTVGEVKPYGAGSDVTQIK